MGYLAVMMAISLKTGERIYITKEKYFNSDDTIELLNKVSHKY